VHDPNAKEGFVSDLGGLIHKNDYLREQLQRCVQCMPAAKKHANALQQITLYLEGLVDIECVEHMDAVVRGVALVRDLREELRAGSLARLCNEFPCHWESTISACMHLCNFDYIKTMQKLARTSKEWWKNNANKYLNKKIE
jgi:hypothetical protein